MEKKRVYVSDIHMGAAKKSEYGKYAYGWLGKKEAEYFAGFLSKLALDKEIGEIILLGDTMDNWVCPIDVVPPTFKEIIVAPENQRIVAELKKLASLTDKKLVYLPGNHDMTITKETLVEYFPGIGFGGSGLYNSVYRTSRLRAEHGSAHALFNAPDPDNNPGNRLPLGYFISRVVATKKARTNCGKRHYWTYVDDLLETLGPQKLPESVFEAMLEEADIHPDAEIKLQMIEGKSNSIKASEVKKKYANLYSQWEQGRGKGIAFKAVMAEFGYLDDIADNLCKKGDTNTVIFGHSHDSALDKDTWFVEDRVYANCGSWCDENKPCSYIETQKDNDSRKHHVRLMEWKNGKAELKKEEVVDL